MRIKSSIASEICFSSHSTSALNDRPSRSLALPSFIKSATQDQTHASLAALTPEPKEKKEAECQDQCWLAHGQQGVYYSYTPTTGLTRASSDVKEYL